MNEQLVHAITEARLQRAAEHRLARQVRSEAARARRANRAPRPAPGWGVGAIAGRIRGRSGRGDRPTGNLGPACP